MRKGITLNNWYIFALMVRFSFEYLFYVACCAIACSFPLKVVIFDVRLSADCAPYFPIAAADESMGECVNGGVCSLHSPLSLRCGWQVTHALTDDDFGLAQRHQKSKGEKRSPPPPPECSSFGGAAPYFVVRQCAK